MSYPEQKSTGRGMATARTPTRQLTVTQVMTIKKSTKKFYNTGNTKFEGHIDNLKTFIYDFVGIPQSELYVQNTKEIGDYVSKTLKNFGNDASGAIQLLEQPACYSQTKSKTCVRG